MRACFDCHSNQTVWPWYSNIAPASWLITWDVNRGKEHLNFSDWSNQVSSEHGLRHLSEVGEIILRGEMPPSQYLILHPQANLTQAEKQALADGLQKTFVVSR